ncbi:MAG: OmpA family protein [Saprospiraceae bacterium]|nr:OmpA family protein [Saprospiraceae bacterium]
MSKATLNLVLFLFLLPATTILAQDNPSNSANFLVHITAFNEKRPVSYFSNLEHVFMKEDNKGIWHYFLGGYKTLEEADSVRRQVFEKGYPYVYVIDVEKVRRECKLTCDSDPSIDPSVPTVMRTIRNTTHLLFDFGRSIIKPDAKVQLNRLSAILNENGKYKVEFKGHTDNIGTPEFNQELSERRAESAAAYLKGRSISSERIKVSSYGMEAPIAKNQKGGKDCPEGRRFNRRVEIFIMDLEGNVLNALVEPLDIPTELLVNTARLKS